MNERHFFIWGRHQSANQLKQNDIDDHGQVEEFQHGQIFGFATRPEKKAFVSVNSCTASWSSERERECVWVCNPFTVPCNLFFPTTTTSLLLALFTRTTPHSLEGGKRNDKRTGFIFFDTCVSSRPDATRREWVGWVGVAVGLIHPGNLDAADNPPPPFATPPLPHPLFNICFNLYEIKLGLDGQWLWFSW